MKSIAEKFVQEADIKSQTERKRMENLAQCMVLSTVLQDVARLSGDVVYLLDKEEARKQYRAINRVGIELSVMLGNTLKADMETSLNALDDAFERVWSRREELLGRMEQSLQNPTSTILGKMPSKVM